MDEKKRRRGAISHIEMPHSWPGRDLFPVRALALLVKGQSLLGWEKKTEWSGTDVDS